MLWKRLALFGLVVTSQAKPLSKESAPGDTIDSLTASKSNGAQGSTWRDWSTTHTNPIATTTPPSESTTTNLSPTKSTSTSGTAPPMTTSFKTTGTSAAQDSSTQVSATISIVYTTDYTTTTWYSRSSTTWSRIWTNLSTVTSNYPLYPVSSTSPIETTQAASPSTTSTSCAPVSSFQCSVSLGTESVTTLLMVSSASESLSVAWYETAPSTPPLSSSIQIATTNVSPATASAAVEPASPSSSTAVAPFTGGASPILGNHLVTTLCGLAVLLVIA